MDNVKCVITHDCYHDPVVKRVVDTSRQEFALVRCSGTVEDAIVKLLVEILMSSTRLMR